MAEYTTAQIAVMTAHSERQVQRWIKEGKLPAQLVQGTKNVYEVAESDLEPLLPRAMTDSLVARIEALEGRVSELEGMIGQAPIKATVHRTYRATGHSSAPGQSDTLPGDLVSYPQFARIHNISVSTVQKAVDAGRLAVVRGQWKQGKSIVQKALDASGRAQFYTLYHGSEHFTECDECPHHE